MTVDRFIDLYGLWIGLGVYILVKDLIPFMLNKFIPERAKAIEQQRRDRLNELSAEREWQHKLDADRLSVLNEISKATQSLSVSMAQTNTNIVALLSGQDRMLRKQDDHHTATMEAISDVRVDQVRRANKAKATRTAVK